MFRIKNHRRRREYQNVEVGEAADPLARSELTMDRETNESDISAEDTEKEQYDHEHSFSKTIPPKFVTDMAITGAVSFEKGCRKEVANVINLIRCDTFLEEDSITWSKDYEDYQGLEADKCNHLVRDMVFRAQLPVVPVTE